MADPKGRDLPRARRYERERRRREREYRDTKGNADLRRGRVESQRNIREARRRVLAQRRQAPARALWRLLAMGARSRRGGSGGVDMTSFAQAGLVTPGESQVRANFGRAFAYEIPKAYVKGRGKPLEADVRFALDAVAGLVKAPYLVATGQGDQLVEGVKRDYSERYKPIVEGDWRELERQVRSKGGLSYGADVAPVGGAVLKTGGAAAKAGAFGARAQRAITRPRAVKRTSFGEAVRQTDETAKAAPNPLRVASQRNRDRARARRFEKRDRRAVSRARELEREGDTPVASRRAVRPQKRRVSFAEAGRARAAVEAAGGRVMRDRRGRVSSVILPARGAERVDASLTGQGFTRQRTGSTVTYFPPREVVGRSRLKERAAQRFSPARNKGRAVNELRGLGAEAQREFRQATKRLSKPEREAAFLAVTGLVSPGNKTAALRHLDELEAQIVAARGARGRPARLKPWQIDNLRTIRYLREHADEAFTPRLAEAVARVGRQIDATETGNPYLDPDRAIRARYGPQAQVLGLDARPPRVQRAARAAVNRRGLDPEAFGERPALPAGRSGARSSPPPEPGRVGPYVIPDPPDLPEGVKAERRQRVRDIMDSGERRRAADAAARDAYVRNGPYGAGRAMAEAVVNGVLGTIPKVTESAPGGRTFARLRRDLERADLSTVGPETALDYALRVARAAERTGRPRPSFAPSEAFFDPHFGSYAAGGAGAPPPLRRRTYELQRTGRQRTDLRVIYDGIQRNLKYRVTANLVADNFNRHTHPVYRDMPLKQLRDAIAREGFDLSQVAVWIPDRYRTSLTQMAAEMERLRREGRRGDAVLEDDVALMSTLDDAVKGAVLQPRALSDLDRVIEVQGGQLRGSLVPRAVSNEIMATTKREGAVARAFERLKTLQSRTVLGSGNVGWLIADFLANGALAAIGGASPLTVAKGLAFYKRLQKSDPEVAKAWADEIDVGPSRFQTHVPHMGAAVNNKAVNAYRAWRSVPGWRSATPLRTLINYFLRAEDVVSNQPWRIGVAYKLLRSETMSRMDRNTGLLHGAQQRLMAGMTLGPEETMRWLLKNQDVVEENGRRLNEVLGDFTTMTEWERRSVGRGLFFYGYLRFSTRMVFWTMPTQHPVKLSILAQIGNLTEDEQRTLVGVDPNDPEDVAMARALMFGRVFSKDPGSPTGISEFNVRSINPFGTAATELEGSQNILTIVPPVAQWAFGQVTKTDVFRNVPWNVGGKYQRSAPRLGEGLIADFVSPKALSVRSRVLLRQLLDLSPITREIQRSRLPGEQAPEANLLTGEVPMRYKGEERQAQADERRKRDKGRDLPELLLQSALRGFVSKPSDISGQVERRRKARNISLGKKVAPTGPLSPAERREVRQASRAAPSGPLSDAERRELRRLMRGR